jgi:hypothetical protein
MEGRAGIPVTGLTLPLFYVNTFRFPSRNSWLGRPILEQNALRFFFNNKSIYIPISISLVWPDLGSNPRPMALVASTLTITPTSRSEKEKGKYTITYGYILLSWSAVDRGLDPNQGLYNWYMLSSSAVDRGLDPNQGLYNWYIYALLECRRSWVRSVWTHV